MRERGIDEETYLTDNPRLHPGRDDSCLSYPTHQTDSPTVLPLTHRTSQTSPRFGLYMVRRSLHHTCRPGEECRDGHQPFPHIMISQHLCLVPSTLWDWTDGSKQSDIFFYDTCLNNLTMINDHREVGASGAAAAGPTAVSC